MSSKLSFSEETGQTSMRTCSKCNCEKELSSSNFRYDPRRDQFRKDCRPCEYITRDKEKLSLNGSNRRSLKLKALPSWSDKEKILSVYREAKIIENSFEGELFEKFHVDHYYPLKGKEVCGLHIYENLGVIPLRDNLRKTNKHPEEFYSSDILK